MGSLSLSYRIFADPSAYADAAGIWQVIFGLVQVCVGLIFFSFIISVLCAALDELIEKIKNGLLPYKKSGHFLIINYNIKLPLILDEINQRASQQKQVYDVVLVFPDNDTIDILRNYLETHCWNSLEVFIRQGDLTSYETYKRLSIEKAFGIVILAPDAHQTDFDRDNFNLKILASLVNSKCFMNHLMQCQRKRKPIKCSIELSDEVCSRKIALAMVDADGEPLFAVASQREVLGNVISRCMVDIVHYKIYVEILSLNGSSIHFVDPNKFSQRGISAGISFEQMLLGFDGGTLIGYSRTNDNGQFQLKICPFAEPLQPADWLLFLTDDPLKITYSNAPLTVDKKIKVIPPSEIASRKICVIGDTWPVDNLSNFIDQASIDFLNKSHYIFDDIEEYFETDFIEMLKHSDYDNIIVNLEDELGFRLTLLLLTSTAINDPFLEKIITIITNPIIEGLLNMNDRYRNSVLSHKIAAKYISQLSFQKNVEKFFLELAYPEGFEFNLLDVGVHISIADFDTVSELKYILASYQMIYVGIVDKEKNIHFDSQNIKEAIQIIVLSQGEY